MTNRNKNSTTMPVILRAEDDEHVASLIDIMLERHGYAVVPVNDGISLLNIIQEHLPPDLVLLDIKLPVVDGYELIQQIRQIREWRDVPIIVLSSIDSEEDIVRAFRAGVNDYVTKPFQPMELMARIENILRQQNVRQATKV